MFPTRFDWIIYQLRESMQSSNASWTMILKHDIDVTTVSAVGQVNQIDWIHQVLIELFSSNIKSSSTPFGSHISMGSD